VPVKVLVLDTYNLLFRSYSSLPAAIVDAGERPAHAVYGLLAAIVRLIREEKPDAILAAFDRPDAPTFRHALYPEYQAQRGPLGGENAEDFARQVEVALAVLPELGVATHGVSGYEADDIMGSAASRWRAEGRDVVIVSTDRDLLQLVGSQVAVVVPGKTPLRITDATGARDRLGVAPEYVTTYKGLAGDASDNIPGVAGIGHKTAVSLVDTYGDLDTIYAHLDALPPRTARALEAGREAAYLYREVATIRTDLDVPPLLPLCITETEGPRELLERAGHPLKPRASAGA